MAEEKAKPKVEEKKEEKAPKGVPPAQKASADADKVGKTKKLDDVKDTPENKEAIAKSEGKIVEKVEEKKVDDVKKDTSAETKFDKIKKEEKAKDEKKIVLEREYVVPLRRGFLKVPQYRRAKKAIRVLREFIAKHMKVEDRDLRKVKVDRFLNEELWFRGIKKPAGKIKVKAVKDSEGIVRVELADVPEIVKFRMAREEKLKAAMANRGKAPKKAKKEDEDKDKDKDKDGVADKVEEKEDAKAGAEMSAKVEKAAAKTTKHTAKAVTGKQEKQQVHRKAMKR
jgi:large subunit ribosomal protein L31e